MVKFWHALAVQLLAVSLRELKSPTPPIIAEPLSLECSCKCPEIPSESKPVWAVIGLSVFGTLTVTGLTALGFLKLRAEGLNGKGREIESPRQRRRGGGILSGPEGRSSGSSVVQ